MVRLLRSEWDNPEVTEALKDMAADEDLKAMLDFARACRVEEPDEEPEPERCIDCQLPNGRHALNCRQQDHRRLRRTK